MSALLRDLRLAVRSLRRRPLLAATAILLLALGVGLTTSVFSLVRSVVLRPLPFSDPERLVLVWESAPHRDLATNVVNVGNYIRWKERARSFSAMSAIFPWQANLGSDDFAERLELGIVDDDFFETLGVPMRLGRGFVPAEGDEGAPAVVVLSSGLWRDRFAADPEIVGTTVRLDGEPATVVGVAPPGLDLPLGVRVWAPLTITPADRDAMGRGLQVVARLAPGSTLASANAEMVEIARQLEIERPEVNPRWSARVVRLDEELTGAFERPLWLLLAAAVGVLLIACANLAGLLMTRNAERRTELALRAALGAGGADLSRPLLVEVALLGLVGGGLGILAARSALAALGAWLPIDLPSFATPRLDRGALLWSVVATVGSALLVGALSAVRASRVEIRDGLSGGGARTVGGSSRLRSALLVAQAALCLVLVAGTALLARSLERLLSVDPGLSVEEVLNGQVSPAGAAYASPEARLAYFARIEERLDGRSGVTAAGWSTWPVLDGLGSSTDFWAADRPAPELGARRVADVRSVTPGFFPAAGLRLVAGRLFAPSDDAEAPPVAVIDEKAARELWPGEDPIGRPVAIWWGEDRVAEVVGVVAELRINALDEPSRGAVFHPLAQFPTSFATLYVRSAADPGATARAIRETLAEIDPTVPIARLQTLERTVAGNTGRPRFLAGLSTLFTTMALLLTAIGLYGLVAGSVLARRRELGVRQALGAQRSRLFADVVVHGLTLVGIGAAIGLPLALAAGHALRSLVFEISPWDPWSLAATVAVVVAVATAACLTPALRAARTDPATALRDE